MEFFRFLGDFLAITSKLAIIRKVKNTKSLSGISLKTQILYLLVYICRYLNLLNFPKKLYEKIGTKGLKLFLYLSLAKVLYLSFQIYIVHLFYSKLKYTYSKKFDTFNIPIFISASCILAFFFHDFRGSYLTAFLEFVGEYCYTFSLILESLAILPQLALIQDSGECEKLTFISITLLGLYRLNYLVYFIFAKLSNLKVDTLLIITSIIQSVLYLDFYRVYYGFFTGGSEYNI